MFTVRQIERLYVARDFSRLLHDLTSHRADALIRWEERANRAILAAAMAAARFDELSQAHHPYCGKLLRIVLEAQDADGGWGDPLSTALCLRALMGSKGDGEAVQRGLAYLAAIQQDEGSFPAGPFRRMAADGHTTAAVLYLLAEYPVFNEAVRTADAAEWLNRQLQTLNDATRILWRHGSLRCRMRSSIAARPVARTAPQRMTKVA